MSPGLQHWHVGPLEKRSSIMLSLVVPVTASPGLRNEHLQSEVGQLQGQLQAEVKRLQVQLQQARAEEEEAQEQRHALKLQLSKVCSSFFFDQAMLCFRKRKIAKSRPIGIIKRNSEDHQGIAAFTAAFSQDCQLLMLLSKTAYPQQQCQQWGFLVCCSASLWKVKGMLFLLFSIALLCKSATHKSATHTESEFGGNTGAGSFSFRYCRAGREAECSAA